MSDTPKDARSTEELLKRLEGELDTIKARNARVESDKAWEGSNTRIAFICAVTYVVAAALMYFIGIQGFLLNALIPVVGFYLSTQSLPLVKRWWIERRDGKQ